MLFIDEQKEALIERMTRLYLKDLIKNTDGNRSEAARVAELLRPGHPSAVAAAAADSWRRP